MKPNSINQYLINELQEVKEELNIGSTEVTSDSIEKKRDENIPVLTQIHLTHENEDVVLTSELVDKLISRIKIHCDERTAKEVEQKAHLLKDELDNPMGFDVPKKA